MLERESNNQLIIKKRLANFHIKHCERPYTIRKISILLNKLILVRDVDIIREARHKLAVAAFYQVPKEIRDKKMNRFIAKYYDENYGNK